LFLTYNAETKVMKQKGPQAELSNKCRGKCFTKTCSHAAMITKNPARIRTTHSLSAAWLASDVICTQRLRQVAFRIDRNM